MEFAWKQSRAVECPQIRHFLDHAQLPRNAARVGADRARVLRVDIAADGAGNEPLGHRLQRCEQGREAALALLHQVQHRPPRRSRAKAGQARHQVEAFSLSGNGLGQYPPRQCRQRQVLARCRQALRAQQDEQELLTTMVRIQLARPATERC